MLCLYLVRGFPGSGKSTIASSLARDGGLVHLETDMFFTLADGIFRYNASRIKEAHEWCQEVTKKTLKSGRSVIVSNTFIQKWEMDPYLLMAKELSTFFQVIECKGKYGSDHGLPKETMERMVTRWEHWNPEWWPGI